MNTRIVHSISSVLRTDGFVRNIHSRNPFDVIRADVVLARMEKQANRACGLHYEIYESVGDGHALPDRSATERPSGIHRRCGSTGLHADGSRRRTRSW